MKARGEELKQWQEQWAPPHIYGNRAKHEALQAFLGLSLDLEEAKRDSNDLHGALLDNEKYFDYMIQELSASLVRAAGMHEGVVGVVQDGWSKQQIVMRVGKAFGRPFNPTNGLAQGCTLSLFVTNVLTTTWYNFISYRIPSTRLGGYVDDRSLRHHRLTGLMDAVHLTQQFDVDSGHKMNVVKTCFFSTSHKARKKLKGVKISGKKLVVPSSSKYLGLAVRGDKRRSSLVVGKAATHYRARLDRIKKLPTGKKHKAKLAHTAGFTKMGYSVLSGFPTKCDLTRSRTRVISTLWSEASRLRCAEAALALHLDPHKVDPLLASACKVLQDIRRLMIKQPEIKQKDL